MKVICLKGGLGNQLFEYCRYRQLMEEGRERIFLYQDHRRLKQHGGLLLSDCFKVSLPSSPWWVSLLVGSVKLLRRLGIFARLYDDERPDCLLIDDYCQSRQYISDAIRYLDFQEFDLSAANQGILSMIAESSYPVAVHVRRGDYLHQVNLSSFGLCPVSYYQRAIRYIRDKHPDVRFFFFSDDMEWVTAHLQTDNAVYVRQAEGEPDYIDLYLMTRCRGHIIANSTFSFWGARLSSLQGINVYPRRWYSHPQWQAPDIFPDDWVSMDE